MESQEVSFTRMPPDSVDKTPKVLPLDSRLPPKFQSIKSLPVGLQFVETSHRSKEDEEEVESPYNRSAFFGNFFQDEDDPVSSVSEASSQFPSAPLPGVDSWWSDTSTNGEKKEIKAWCKLQNGEWALGKIVSNTGEDVILSVPKGKVVKVHRDTLLRANPDILDGVDDLMQLSYLNEPSVLYNLQYRYSQNIIYTKSGPVLIAINPYKEVNLYGSEYIRAYRRRSINKPHVYALTDTAMREMIRDEISQSIIISGESGSGKTETAKIAMQYLVALGGGSGIEYEILQSNPILEAFGNAKTLRNDNSSRFGKLIEIHFSATGRISSARIQTFLLEKSRVVQCSERERSYHIFYQLCSGAPLSLREKLNLKNVDEYEYLKQSKCFQIAGVNDSQSFHEVMKALDAVHISWEDQEKVFAMISAVLWLGNISFTSIDNEDHVEPIIDEGVHTVARLMGCNIEVLKLTLSTRKMEVHKEQIVKKLTLSQAIDTRDALAKSIYVSLFEWLVEQINKSLTVGKKRTGRYISILDIYGFEYFQKNTFEQFCINYANERLQQHFNRHLFKLEQEEYIQDGIDWEKMDFDDNQDCLNLFEKKPLGLLSLLDEESTFPNATDLSFANKLKKHLCSNPCFRGERGKNFIVRHYAGEVVYDTFGFLEKNRDVLSMDSIQLLSSCSSELPQSFAAKLISQSENSISNLAGDSQKMSATSKFKDQLFQLIQRLERTTPHFIRCIKPNKLQLPDIYEQAFILQQLKCCGVLEVGRISRSGYPTRMPHQKFARRYGFLLLESIASQDPLTVSVAILQQFNIHPEMYHVGYTKLFFRMGQIGALEDTRNRTLHGILRLQSVFRGHRARCNVRNYRNGIVELQSFVRGQKTRAMYNVLVMRLRASIVLQRHIKSKIARREFLNIQKASIVIQTGIRGELVRCLGHVGTKFYDTDQVLVKASVLADLQQRVLKAEAEVKRKEEENESLRKDQEEYNRKWLENKNNLRLMEEHWQKQMASLQNNFSLLKKKMMVKGGSERNRFSWSSIMMNGSIKAGSSDTIIGLSNEFAQRSESFADDAKSLMEVNSNQTEGSSTPQQDLKKLKTSFDTWKKDFNSRLKETKINVNKLGNDENSDVIKKKKWWGRLRTLKNEMSG